MTEFFPTASPSLMIAIYCGISFILLGLLAIVCQTSNMRSFHRNFEEMQEGKKLKSPFGLKMMITAMSGFLSASSAIAGIIALIFHFVK